MKENEILEKIDSISISLSRATGLGCSIWVKRTLKMWKSFRSEFIFKDYGLTSIEYCIQMAENYKHRISSLFIEIDGYYIDRYENGKLKVERICIDIDTYKSQMKNIDNMCMLCAKLVGINNSTRYIYLTTILQAMKESYSHSISILESEWGND